MTGIQTQKTNMVKTAILHFATQELYKMHYYGITGVKNYNSFASRQYIGDIWY